MAKEVKKSTRGKSFYLSILEGLNQGLNPSKISEKLNISKQRLQYYLSKLKAQGVIEKIGYGTWKQVKEFNLKEVKKLTRVAPDQLRKSFTSLEPDTVRAHAFQFKYELPKNLKNWERREELMKKAKMKFEPLKLGGIKRGQRILIKGRKVWLLDKSIIIYEQESFFASKAGKARSKAINHFVKLLRACERYLKADLQLHKSRFKVSRQHYALVKNALAKQYDDNGKRLHCYTGEGLWFLIDNSFNLHEAETVHPKSAVKDNEKVQDFFNGIKKHEGFTPDFIVNSLGNTTQIMQHLDHNLKTHFSVLDRIAKAVTNLEKEVKKFGEKL